MTDYHAINKKAWDKRVAIHVESKFYGVNGFLQGNSSLTEIETVELGNVSHKSLLHLQCHFGLDSLSLARMGARVTAVDLSSAAIDKANELHDKINGVEMDTATWTHPISEVVNALIQAGLSIRHLNEFPYSPYNCFEGLTETENNRFTLIENGQAKPLVYSIKATKS